MTSPFPPWWPQAQEMRVHVGGDKPTEHALNQTGLYARQEQEQPPPMRATIVPDSPNLKIGLKRKELVPGSRYVIKQKNRGWPRPPLTYLHVHLVELLPSNRALVQWDEPCWVGPLGDPLPTHPLSIPHSQHRPGKRTRLVKVSCSAFVATEADWDRFPKMWNAKRKCLMLDMTEIQGEQGSMERHG